MPGRRSPALLALASGFLLAAVTVPFALPELSVPDCELDGTWECRALVVPADHFDPDPRPRLADVLYAVHPAAAPAAGQTRRVLVLVTGGPGASGIADGSWTVDWLDPRITREFDVVTFDPRGVGGSGGVDCPAAAGRFYERSLTEEVARGFVELRLAEAGVPAEDLDQYGSAQVVEDLEAIRRALGRDRITLYGVSYGTVVAQAYAAAHPTGWTGSSSTRRSTGR
jgi:pimeloyl-ACP methyl ester carboxylesterase